MKKRSAVDLVNLACGAVVGRGVFRTVFECRFNPEWVLKHDTQENRSNIFEHSLWNELRGTALEKWLAPVEWISDDGFWLVQQKTEPLRRADLPKKVPSIFCDLKLANWGMLNGRPVCHDYGNSLLYALARKHGAALKNANWMDT